MTPSVRKQGLDKSKQFGVLAPFLQRGAKGNGKRHANTSEALDADGSLAGVTACMKKYGRCEIEVIWH